MHLSRNSNVFSADIHRGEYITGFSVRAGAWIDAIQVLTSRGRRSPLYGNVQGGSAYASILPVMTTVTRDAANRFG